MTIIPESTTSLNDPNITEHARMTRAPGSNTRVIDLADYCVNISIAAGQNRSLFS